MNTLLNVEGMSCGHCKAAVEKGLGSVRGVLNVAVNLEAKQVAVEFDTNLVELQQLKQTIEDLGYDVVD